MQRSQVPWELQKDQALGAGTAFGAPDKPTGPAYVTVRTELVVPNGLGTRKVHSGSSRHSPSTKNR